MARSPETPLLRAFRRLCDVLSTKDLARSWYERYLAILGERAVVDTCNDGSLTWVHRRAAGADEVLPQASVRWTKVQVADRLMEGVEIADGRQRLTLLYDDTGKIGDRSMDDRFPGRLGGLSRAIAEAEDGFTSSVAFVAGLGDEQHGPGRVHYPVHSPRGVGGAWRTGLMACRRALFDGRVGPEARFVVADGLAGTAVGAGATREEALAAYAAEVARSVPEPKHEIQTATDDYDDDGNLIQRGEIPPEFREPGPPPDAFTVLGQPGEQECEAWREQPEPGTPTPPPTPEIDPITGRIDFGTIVIRGPKSDAPPLPRRPECLPHVLIPLDASPVDPPPRGRWLRLLGELGVTRHVARIEERDGFMLVGADLLGLIDLATLRADLDRIDERDPLYMGAPETQRYMRFRARQFRWAPATNTRPEGMVSAGGSCGPRFEAGGLDGDQLQAMIFRFRKVLRPKD